MPVGETLVHNGGISSAAFSPVNNWVVVGVESGQLIHVWDVQSGSRVCDPLKDHTGYIASAAFSPDGKSILSGSYDHTAWTWALGSQIFKPDGKQIVLGSKDCSLRLWDAETNTIIGSPLPCSGKPEGPLAISPDHKWIAVAGSMKQTIRFWNTETCSQAGHGLTAHTRPVTHIGFSPDGKRLVSVSNDNIMRVWDVE
ncbi:hypothetical protein ID866_12429, partial [Astraeus odoratus]